MSFLQSKLALASIILAVVAVFVGVCVFSPPQETSSNSVATIMVCRAFEKFSPVNHQGHEKLVHFKTVCHVDIMSLWFASKPYFSSIFS